MRLTVVGCGDAWGGAGRGHTCFRLDVDGRVVVIDFGASAIVNWHKLGFSTDEIDVVAISHLHGDHFGGLPFLLLNAQYETRRKKPLRIIGPPGTRDRLARAVDVFYPGVASGGWRFEWSVEELEPGLEADLFGARLSSIAVSHGGAVLGTGLRLEAGGKTFAYSGDTEWTEALIGLADGADLFVIECYSARLEIEGHLNWPRLRQNLDRLTARRIAVTHMGSAMRACQGELTAAGLEVLDDGQVLDI